MEQLNQHLISNNWRPSTTNNSNNQNNNTNNNNNNNNNNTNSNSSSNAQNISSNLSSSINNVTNNVTNMQNINLINAISRTPTSIITTTVTPVSSKRKTGAERLFQYMEADDSDPELDYAR